MKFYSWSRQPAWTAVVHSTSIIKARELMLGLLPADDGSCIVRERARDYIVAFQPVLIAVPVAVFSLTDSAAMEEMEHALHALHDRNDQLIDMIETLIRMLNQ